MDSVSALPARAADHPSRVRLTPLGLAALLTLVGLTVRLVGIGIRPLWLDEAYSAWFSARGWAELWTVVPTYETHPPFYYSLLKLWRALFGGEAVALRLPSVLFGAVTVPVVVAAAFELERSRPTGRPLLLAGIAGFLAACGPTLVQHGQEARPYALMVLAYALAILGLLRLLRELSGGSAGEWRSWLLLGTGTELTLWAHSLGALYALCLAGALAPAWLRQAATLQRRLRGLATAAAVALLYLPCLLIIAPRTTDWSNGWLDWQPELLLKLLGLYAVPVEVLTIGSAFAALTMLLLAKRAVEAAAAERGWSSGRALLLLWWAPPLITALVSALAMPLFLPRTLTPTIIPCYLALAHALAASASRTERLALTAALVATLPPSTLQMALRPASEPWDQVNAFLERHSRPGDLVWLYPNDGALALREAGRRSTFRRRGIPGDYPALGVAGPVRAGSAAVVSLTAAGARKLGADPALRAVPTIWLVTTHAEFFDPRGDVARALARSRRAGPRQRWGYIAAQPFTLGAVRSPFNRQTGTVK